MAPLTRLGTFSDKEFERFVLEWVHGYLKKQYSEVQQRGGAGDKSRDIVAWIDPHGTNPRRWDNYQCKHYKDPLSPSTIWVELGKLCYYTYKGDYTIPEHYYLVTHKGIGSTLADLLENPSRINQGLISNWQSHCYDKITVVEKLSLMGELKEYVESFDFSIVRSIPPLTLIDQHSETRYHALIFGNSLKPRPEPMIPPDTIASHETRYVQQIFEAFSEYLKTEVKERSEIDHLADLKQVFDRARVGFYSAESLKEFSRDNLPHDDYFQDLLNQFLEGIELTLLRPFPDGYKRMTKTTEQALNLQIDSNILKDDLRPRDRIGICHQLANEDKLTWVRR